MFIPAPDFSEKIKSFSIKQQAFHDSFDTGMAELQEDGLWRLLESRHCLIKGILEPFRLNLSFVKQKKSICTLLAAIRNTNVKPEMKTLSSSVISYNA